MALATRLRTSGASLAALVDGLDPALWNHVPAPGVWTVGKEAEHAAEGILLHLWSVRLTLGEPVASRRPTVERRRLTTTLSAHDVGDLLRTRIEEAARVVERLSDAQLERVTRPPRAREQRLSETIERVLIGHMERHRPEIEGKVRAASSC